MNLFQQIYVLGFDHVLELHGLFICGISLSLFLCHPILQITESLLYAYSFTRLNAHEVAIIFKEIIRNYIAVTSY